MVPRSGLTLSLKVALCLKSQKKNLGDDTSASDQKNLSNLEINNTNETALANNHSKAMNLKLQT